MGGIFGLFAGSREQKSASGTSYGAVDELWGAFLGSRPTSSGVSITWKRALEVTTALRCAAIVAEGICSVPFKLYRREKDGKGRWSRVEARDHALYDLITAAPNDFQTSFELRETLSMHTLFCGNAYAFVNRVRGEVREIIPLEDASVERLPDWSLEYRATSPGGQLEVFGSDQIWHLRGRSWNGYKGLETIQLAREALGLAVAIEEGQGAIHKNGARPGGLLSIEGTLDEPGFKLWRALIDKQYVGRVNDGKAMILDRNAKFTPLQFSAADAQTIETRRFQIERICEAFGVLPILVGAGDKSATYASSEQMFLAHLVHTVRPWHRRIEQSADRWLLTKKEREAGYYFGFVDTELLRGDHKARAEYYRARWSMGSMTGNEIRGYEDEAPLDGLDRPWAPMNSAPIGADGQPILPPKAALAADPAPEKDDPDAD
ncbi:phage portal protein [Aureimonas phyllosphaerae]|uniref:phage portal protein n=1 Tax=Aureimonas phyllosphaerae TaxID=1166078 RepID=UPI003A5BE6EF